ncbi:sugar porter family MFS transporter [Diaminobutyricibacter tongyongensis]|uniref:Sugar porter family MFS transporter n=1 Tax=Leifsonia tongyongensis TaxID=1268043 RepID=A0A6L9XZE4_9MICO|nr:sugar porter family MFS transporter [Diaminobutyricibacter tongyongensis]NEN06676.1 sugar porter family MFS transporter [Diaminobutyricibacter tongyongensis]
MSDAQDGTQNTDRSASSDNEEWEGAKPTPAMRRKVTGLALAAAVGGFLFGFDSSVINGAVNSVQGHFALNAFVTGFIVAIALLGCAAGAYIAGRLADRWGRLKVMLLGAVMFLVSSIGAGLAFSAWDLGFWRIVGGLGIGIASVVAPAYIAEISPRQSRGKLASLQQLAITVGIFIALLSDALLAGIAGSASSQLWLGLEAWRWMFLVGVIPSVVYGILALRLPESPRYLLATGRRDEAREIFSTLVPESDLDRQIGDIERSIAEDKEGLKATLRGKAFGLKPIVWIGITLSVFQQFVGINVIFYYSTTLWRAVGFTEKNSLLITVITSVTNVLVTIVAIMLVDRVGRRPILLTGSIGMTISLGTMALAFSFADKVHGAVTLPSPWGPIALVAANVFVVCFGASWGPLVWVLLGEIFPTKIRAKALGVAAAAQWIANFLVTVTFPPLADFSLVFTYGMYAVFAALSFIFVFFTIPETNGMALEHAETLFANARKSRGVSVTSSGDSIG